MVDPVDFIYAYADRIFHMHVKESIRVLNGRTVSWARTSFSATTGGAGTSSRPAAAACPLSDIFRALNDVGYVGPLSVEWEDNGMNREQGAPEALQMVRRLDLVPSNVAFDAAFASKS